MNRLSATFVAGLLLALVLPGVASAAGNSVIYSSLISSPLHGNVASVGAEAYAFNELGNAVTFSNSPNRSLTSVSVTMSSWGCQTGHWTSGDCVTTKGATFSQPITLNIYGPDGTTLIASAAQTFAIPYRPSANTTKCTGPDAGKWYDNALKDCFNGLATNITFDSFTYTGGVAVALPDSIVFGIAYNTTHYGYSPIGESASCFASSGGCAYDSLNIALSVTVSPGTAGLVYVNKSLSSDYDPYVPAVQFKAAR